MADRKSELKLAIEESLSADFLEGVQQAILGYVHAQAPMKELGLELANEYNQHPDLYLTALLQKVGIHKAKSKLSKQISSPTLEQVINEIIHLPVLKYQYIANDNLEKLSFSVIASKK